MQQDYIYSLAEIRRAHNTNAAETDNPSCQPGALSRFLTPTNKHPSFAQEKAPEQSKKVIEEAVCTLVQRVVDEESQTKEGMDARLMLATLNLYAQHNEQNRNVLKKPHFIEDYILTATAEDIENLDAQDEKRALGLFLDKSQQLRQQLMQKLLGGNNASIYDAVVSRLNEANLSHHPEELNYLIAKYLANIPGLISIPSSLLTAWRSTTLQDDSVESPQQTQAERFGQALLQEFATDIQNAPELDKERLETALFDLANAFNVHLTRLNESDYIQKTNHESVVQTKFESFAGLPEELTQERVCKVLREMHPLPSRTSSSMRAELAALRNEDAPASSNVRPK